LPAAASTFFTRDDCDATVMTSKSYGEICTRLV
jgi:hypothetical protein